MMCKIVNSFNGEEVDREFLSKEDAEKALPAVALEEWGGPMQGSLKDWVIVVPQDAVWKFDHIGGGGVNPNFAWTYQGEVYR
jgi:hypothetical protein